MLGVHGSMGSTIPMGTQSPIQSTSQSSRVQPGLEQNANQGHVLPLASGKGAGTRTQPQGLNEGSKECDPFGKSYSRGLREVPQESPSSSSSKHGRIIPAQSLYLGLSHPATTA